MFQSIPSHEELRAMLARIHEFPSGLGRLEALIRILTDVSPLFGGERRLWDALGVSEVQLYGSLASQDPRKRYFYKTALRRIRERIVTHLTDKRGRALPVVESDRHFSSALRGNPSRRRICIARGNL